VYNINAKCDESSVYTVKFIPKCPPDVLVQNAENDNLVRMSNNIQILMSLSAVHTQNKFYDF